MESKTKLLDPMRLVLRLKPMSFRTEEAYVNGARRFILLHHKRHPKDMGAQKIRAFPGHLAVHDHVAASTQHVALNTLLFLYRHVLKQDFSDLVDLEPGVRRQGPGHGQALALPTAELMRKEAGRGERLSQRTCKVRLKHLFCRYKANPARYGVSESSQGFPEMHRLFFENVRCFFTPQSAPLRPITLLVGENSSGKSTFLALVRLAWDLCQGISPLDLNEEPFLLGAYDQIASSRRGPGGRAQQFCIGAEVLSKGPKRGRRSVVRSTDSITVKGRFVRKEGQPHLQELVLEAAPFRIEILYEERDKPPRLTLQSPAGSMGIADFPMFPQPWPSLPLFFNYLRYWRSSSRKITPQEAPSIAGEPLPSADLEALEELTFALHRGLDQRPYAFAPVRTRPRRTYDPLKDIPDPEGSHMPMILAKAFTSDPTASAQLREAIEAFGRASGLFTDIDIRRIGRKEGDPFQLQVKIAGSGINLVDVGYGVSQVLPIIVDAIREPPGSTFLLQQPEVHLHPRAQAELGSFLATLAKQQQKRFIIETHSDYMIDRIRMDIRDGKHLKPSEVAILYFERVGGVAQIHTMEIDPFGNLIEVPPGYRQFFLEEERRLLGG